jgi:hypothetical protein
MVKISVGRLLVRKAMTTMATKISGSDTNRSIVRITAFSVRPPV